MANYGRGWADGYGSQSAESIEAYQDQQEIEAGRLQNAADRRREEKDKHDKKWADEMTSLLSRYNAAPKVTRDLVRSILGMTTPKDRERDDAGEPYDDKKGAKS